MATLKLVRVIFSVLMNKIYWKQVKLLLSNKIKFCESDTCHTLYYHLFCFVSIQQGSIGRISGENKQTVEDPLSIGNNCKYTEPKKPPFTYTELIEYALSEKGELTVSGIYQWIS